MQAAHISAMAEPVAWPPQPRLPVPLQWTQGRAPVPWHRLHLQGGAAGQVLASAHGPALVQ